MDISLRPLKVQSGQSSGVGLGAASAEEPPAADAGSASRFGRVIRWVLGWWRRRGGQDAPHGLGDAADAGGQTLVDRPPEAFPIELGGGRRWRIRGRGGGGGGPGGRAAGGGGGRRAAARPWR